MSIVNHRDGEIKAVTAGVNTCRVLRKRGRGKGGERKKVWGVWGVWGV